jgi:DNA-binding beta-propeller fold protein YncE
MRWIRVGALALLCAPVVPVLSAAPPLIARSPILVPGGAGGFDWMTVDGPLKRVLAAHKGTGTLAVLDVEHGKLLPAVHTGAAQGVAVDARDNKIFVGNEAEQSVVVLNRKTLAKEAEIKVEGPVDAVAFDPKNGRVYADHDDGTDVWVIDGKTNQRLGLIKIAEAPEYLEYDPTSDRIYQNIKSNDSVQVINPGSNAVVAKWSTAPATGPHGLALDVKTRRLFTAGKNGKLAVLDLADGKLVTSVDIAPGVDQIAFDPGNRRVYCACAGSISVVEETVDGGARLVENVQSPKGAHTITVEPNTHSVWICYADQQHSYLQEYATH